MKKIFLTGVVFLLFLVTPLFVYAASKSIESVKSARNGLPSAVTKAGYTTPIVTYERVCLGGLEFVGVIGGGYGEGFSLNPNIIQVIGENGKPKTCK